MPITHYVFDESHFREEGMTKEQILNAIAEATGVTPTSVDEGFITTIVETNNGKNIHIWKGTKAQFDALASVDVDTLYIITDDTSVTDLMEDYEELSSAYQIMSEDVENLKETVYQIDDTGWLDWEQTPLQAGTTDVIGKYRVKNGIAYFDLKDYIVAHYQNEGDIINIPLPVKLDVSGNAGIPVVYMANISSSIKTYLSAQGSLSNSGDTTTLTIEANGTGSDSVMSEVWTSFSYPIYVEE